MAGPVPQLDHIVILLPYKDVQSPPKWLTSNFTISPGGRHGDAKTENRLIVFRDGTYLELIAFIDDSPQHMAGHWWDPAHKGYGVVDYAFTLPARQDHPGKEDANAGAAADDPVAAFERLRSHVILPLDIPEPWKPQPLRGGSRQRPDGVRIEWQVAFPRGEARGRAPFWCFDVTERERRVPAGEERATRHPCGAVGVAGLTIFVVDGKGEGEGEGESAGGEGGSESQGLRRLFDEILPRYPSFALGAEGKREGKDEGEGEGESEDGLWALAPPKQIDAGTVPCQLRVARATDSNDLKALREGRRQLVARIQLRGKEGPVNVDFDTPFRRL